MDAVLLPAISLCVLGVICSSSSTSVVVVGRAGGTQHAMLLVKWLPSGCEGSMYLARVLSAAGHSSGIHVLVGLELAGVSFFCCLESVESTL